MRRADGCIHLARLLCGILAAIVPMLAAEAQQLPAVVESFLEGNSRYRLVEPADVPLSDELASGRIAPYAVGDTNLDGADDVAAVFLREGRFHVAVFHAPQDPESPVPVWLLRDETEPVSGVTVIVDAVVPIRSCVDCDSNPFYRWLGSEYGRDAYLPGRTVCLGSGTPVREEASDISAVLYWTLAAVEASVLAVGRAENDVRWYRVSFNAGQPIEGYVRDSRFSKGPGLCVE